VASALAQGNVPTLKQIMEDPSWFARSPESLGWLADGSAVLYEQRREGVLGRDTKDRYVLLLDGVTPVRGPLMMEEIAAADAAHSTVISVHNSLYCNGLLQCA
jgi:hypothetical protein